MASFSDWNASAVAFATPPSSSVTATMDFRDCAVPALRSRAVALRTSRSSGSCWPFVRSFAVMGDLQVESVACRSTSPELPEHAAHNDDRDQSAEGDPEHERARSLVQRGQQADAELRDVRQEDQDDERPDDHPEVPEQE